MRTMIFAKIKIDGLSEAEQNAKEILAHVEAIRNLQATARMLGIGVEIETEGEETASGN